MQLTSLFSLALSASFALASPTPTVKERASICLPFGIAPAEALRVVSKFRSSSVVPTLIPSIRPRVEVDVAYGDKQVDLGNKFTTAETLIPPDVSFSAEPGFDPRKTKYMYFLVDPDVPNQDGVPIVGLRLNFLHLAVMDAQPSCIKDQSPKTITLYEPLTPASTTQHRYTFLVYRQSPGFELDPVDLVALQARPGFDINGFAARNGLKLVGGNFLREGLTNGIVPEE